MACRGDLEAPMLALARPSGLPPCPPAPGPCLMVPSDPSPCLIAPDPCPIAPCGPPACLSARNPCPCDPLPCLSDPCGPPPCLPAAEPCPAAPCGPPPCPPDPDPGPAGPCDPSPCLSTPDPCPMGPRGPPPCLFPCDPCPAGPMASTDVLLTRQSAPQSLPAAELPPKVYEVARNTGAYTSSGLATAGFRTAKYLLDEWFQNCYARYHQAFADRDHSERLRHESQHLAAETEDRAQRTQGDSTRKVGARLQDTHSWMTELRRELEMLASETHLLLAQKRRLELALDATALPFSIATDNLQSRERRQHPDLVRDCVEIELLKETELIRNIQELLKRTIKQAVNQIRLNRQHKESCEMDWSDKVEAYNIDHTCTLYHNQSTQVQFYPHSASFHESASTTQSWHQFTQDNLLRAEREHLASANLRALVDCILHDTSEDLRMQCDTVNLAFQRRCEELEDARHKLEYHLHKTLREITEQEHNVARLKQAIKDKEAPLKVAETRLYQRSHRPNVELCRDSAQYRLVCEVQELNLSLAALKEKLLEAEQALRNLEDTRMSLEKEIAVKTNSLLIDQQKCMARRAHYPTILQLAGYQ